jgi:hypothetical protein
MPGKVSAGAAAPPDPSKIMQVGMGFWASKVLLAAVKFRLFTILAEGPKKAAEIKSRLHLKTTDRHVFDWLDVLASFGFLQREGLLEAAVYSNSPEAATYLDHNNPRYIGGVLEMGNNRLYRFWGDLEEALATGLPQSESKGGGNMDFFIELYKDPEKLQEFMDAMSGIQQGNFHTLVKKFDFARYQTVGDIGGADASLAIVICREYPQVKCITYDLPPVRPLAQKKIDAAGMQSRITAESGDFMKDALPSAEVYTLGNIIHGLDEEGKLALMKKLYQQLPDGGAIIILENIIDDDRRLNSFGMMMSLNMLIENGEAFDYTFVDFQKWAGKTGFRRTEILPLTGPTSAAIAYK